MTDPAMPPGRVDPGDERHLAGAFQDNRVIPFEGIRVAAMPPRPRSWYSPWPSGSRSCCPLARGRPGCGK
jgi:hypothetical protein